MPRKPPRLSLDLLRGFRASGRHLSFTKGESSGTTETVSVKGGSLDDPVDLSHAGHIWTARTLVGVVIPEGATRFERGPDE